MPGSRAVVLGCFTAFASMFALFAATRWFGEADPVFFVLPGLGLVVAGLSAGGRGLVRGVVGVVVGVLAALAVMAWLDGRAGIGGDALRDQLVVSLAGVCGGMAASARRGLALAVGYIFGFIALMLPAVLMGDGREWKFVAAFGLILGAGAVAGRVVGGVAR